METAPRAPASTADTVDWPTFALRASSRCRHRFRCRRARSWWPILTRFMGASWRVPLICDSPAALELIHSRISLRADLWLGSSPVAGPKPGPRMLVASTADQLGARDEIN